MISANDPEYYTVIKLFEALKRRGIGTILTNGHLNNGPSVSLIVRSDHSLENIQYLCYQIREIYLKLNAQLSFL